MERAIRELPGGKFIHEPFVNAYMYGNDHVSSRYARDAPESMDVTFESTTQMLLADYPEHDFVFVKDMTFAVGHMVDEVLDRLASFQHTFLVRPPLLLIPHFYEISTKPELVGRNESGFRQAYDL